MTRLIDADALNFVRVRIQYDDGTIGGYNAVIPSSEIKNAPTVDAVPVEWIKQWSKKPMTEKDTKLAEQCEWDILEWLIADWQKEKKNELFQKDV